MKYLLFICVVVRARDILYPYGAGQGDFKHGTIDDACDGVYNYPLEIFGKTFHKIYICTNGDISLDKKFETYASEGFPLKPKSGTTTLICPFWADVDLTEGGSLWSRETTDPVLLEKASLEVRQSYTTASSFTATWMLIATWDGVMPYFTKGGKIPFLKPKVGNTFQTILLSDGIGSFAIFTYRDINWISSATVIEPAQIGFDAGDGRHFYAVKGSRTPDIINIKSYSNKGIPGKMIFQLSSVNSAVSSGNNSVALILPPDITQRASTQATSTTTKTIAALNTGQQSGRWAAAPNGTQVPRPTSNIGGKRLSQDIPTNTNSGGQGGRQGTTRKIRTLAPTEPSEKPATPLTSTEPTEKPATPLTSTEPTEKPATPLTSTEPTEKPATPLTSTEPTEKPATPLTSTKPTEKPATPLTSTEPTEKPTRPLTSTEPTEKPTTPLTSTEPTDKQTRNQPELSAFEFISFTKITLAKVKDSTKSGLGSLLAKLLKVTEIESLK